MAVRARRFGERASGTRSSRPPSARPGRPGRARIALHAQVDARSLYARGGFVESGERFEEAGIAHVTMEKRPCLRSASTRSPASRRSSPASAPTAPAAGFERRAAAAARPRAPTRSPRATRTARRPRSTRCARTAARPTRRAGRCASCPTSIPALAPDAPAPEPEASPDLFGAAAAHGAHEVIVNAPEPVGDAGRAARRAGRRRRSRCGASGSARHTPTPRYVHVIVNERREAGSSLPHTHAQLYALDFVPAAGRARARALRRPRHAHDGRQPARRPRPGGGPPRASASSRSTTRRCSSRPTRRACPSSCMLAARDGRARASRTTGRPAPRCSTTPCAASQRRLGAAPAAEPLGPHRAPRRRALLLADRHRARASTHLAGLELGTGRAPEHRRARARRRRAARRVIAIAATIAASVAIGIAAERRCGRRRPAGRARRPRWGCSTRSSRSSCSSTSRGCDVDVGRRRRARAGLSHARAHRAGRLRWSAPALLRLSRPGHRLAHRRASMQVNTGYVGLPLAVALLGLRTRSARRSPTTRSSPRPGCSAPSSRSARRSAATPARAPASGRGRSSCATRRCWPSCAAVIAPDALAPDVLVDASRVMVFALIPLGFFARRRHPRRRGRGGQASRSRRR